MTTVRSAYLIEDRLFVAPSREDEPQAAERLASATKLAIRPAIRRFHRGGRGSQDSPLEHSDLVIAFAEANPDLGFGEPVDRRDEYGISYMLPSQYDFEVYALSLQDRAFGMPVMINILHRYADVPGRRSDGLSVTMHEQAPLLRWVNAQMDQQILFGLDVEYGQIEPVHRDHFRDLERLRSMNGIMRSAKQIEKIRNGMACQALFDEARM